MSQRAMALSPPDAFLLDEWCATLYEAFGEFPYVCGSVIGDGPYRDVDLRLPIAEEWPVSARRFRAINTAISLWGRQVTGLPIDFQFQSMAEFHEYDGKGLRWPMGVDAIARERGVA